MRWIALAMPLAVAACGREPESSGPGPAPSVVGDRAKDPVCGMMVDKATASKVMQDGASYYFCADECVKKFEAQPRQYVAACGCGRVTAKCACEHCGKKGIACDCN